MPNKLLAELNNDYIFGLLDNSEDPTSGYRTSIFPVATFTPGGEIHTFSRGCRESCSGLHSLILIPKSEECYEDLFKVRIYCIFIISNLKGRFFSEGDGDIFQFVKLPFM